MGSNPTAVKFLHSLPSDYRRILGPKRTERCPHTARYMRNFLKQRPIFNKPWAVVGDPGPRNLGCSGRMWVSIITAYPRLHKINNLNQLTVSTDEMRAFIQASRHLVFRQPKKTTSLQFTCLHTRLLSTSRSWTDEAFHLPVGNNGSISLR